MIEDRVVKGVKGEIGKVTLYIIMSKVRETNKFRRSCVNLDEIRRHKGSGPLDRHCLR